MSCFHTVYTHVATPLLTIKNNVFQIVAGTKKLGTGEPRRRKGRCGETASHTVCFGLFIGFVDNSKNIEHNLVPYLNKTSAF